MMMYQHLYIKTSLLSVSLLISSYCSAEDKLPKTALDPISGGNIGQLAIGLLAVVAVVFILGWFLKNVMRGGAVASGALKIIAGVSMGARERVVLMQVGETQILIGVTPGRIEKIHVLDKPIDVENTSNPTASFAARLSEVLMKGKRNEN